MKRITEVVFYFVFSFTVKEGFKKERRPITNRQLLYQSSLLPHFLPHGTTVTTCMRNHNDDAIRRATQFFRKIYLSLYLKGFERVVWERELKTEQNCSILSPTLMAITVFLSRSPGLLNRGLWWPASLGARFLYRILSPIDWTSCALSYIIIQRLPSSCGRHKSHSFNPSSVKVIFWYSPTGCTCYLHRCISYFDSSAGSEVNIQHFPMDINLKVKVTGIQTHLLRCCSTR